MSRGATDFALSFDRKRSSSCSAWTLSFVRPFWILVLARTILAVCLCWPLPRSMSRLSCIPSNLCHGLSIAYNTASSCRISFDVPGTQSNHPRHRLPGLSCGAFEVESLAAPEPRRVSLPAPRFSSSRRLVQCLLLRARAAVRVGRIVTWAFC